MENKTRQVYSRLGVDERKILHTFLEFITTRNISSALKHLHISLDPIPVSYETNFHIYSEVRHSVTHPKVNDMIFVWNLVQLRISKAKHTVTDTSPQGAASTKI
jgi:hypothetical protein